MQTRIATDEAEPPEIKNNSTHHLSGIELGGEVAPIWWTHGWCAKSLFISEV
jgi:hypothetical protein